MLLRLFILHQAPMSDPRNFDMNMETLDTCFLANMMEVFLQTGDAHLDTYPCPMLPKCDNDTEPVNLPNDRDASLIILIISRILFD